MREGWEKAALADVCKLFTDGDWIQTKDQSPEGIRLIQTGNVGFGEFKDRRKKARFISNQTFLRLKCQEVRPDDCLISRLPDPVGRSCIIPATGEKMITAVDCTILRFDEAKLVPRFFSYYSQSTEYLRNVEAHCTGATRKRISRKNLGKVALPIPPLPEQKRIVAILDEAFAGIETAIANTEKNLANARELFESYLNSVFSQRGEGWAEVKINDACSSIIDCVNKTAPQVEGPTPFKMIRTTNVRNGFVNLDSVKFVTGEIYKTWTRRQVPKRGDVILTREAPLGEVGLLDTDEKVFLGQRLVSYRVNPEILDNRFLLYSFQSIYVQSQIHALASGSTVQHMRVPDSKKLRIFLPPLNVQMELVDFLDFIRAQTQHLQSIYQQKLTALAELKQSLLQKAFSGELTADKNRCHQQVPEPVL